MKRPFVIGLTGAIGAGKSTALAFFKKKGLKTFSADLAVHGFLEKGGVAVPALARLFPEAFRRGAIERRTLSRILLERPEALMDLEKILHPLAFRAEQDFIKSAKGEKAVVLEVPLLFETNADRLCDVTLCLSVPRAELKRRVLSREGMTEAKLKTFLRRQMSNAERKRRADVVIDTRFGLDDTYRRLERFMKRIP